MYAIVEIAGKQFRVSKEQSLKVPRLDGDSGSKIKFDKVLFYADDNGKNQIGKPNISNMAVSATIIEHGRDKKIIVFKKKRRKGYQVKNGHRQGFSVIKIDNISTTKSTASKPSAKTEAKPKMASKVKTETTAKPKAVPKSASKAKPKAAPKPKTAAKKSAEKKTSAKPKAAKPKTETKKASSKKKEA
jgi:large subunit ribosomal protein L21